MWILVAVLVFWCVGMYNRIMRLRALATAALGSLQAVVQQCIGLLQNQLPPTWAALHQMARALDDASRQAMANPLQLRPQQVFGECLDALLSQWAATCAISADVSDAPVPAELRLRWDDLQPRLQTSRAELNACVQRYNEALQQFPARLVVGMLGLRPASPL